MKTFAFVFARGGSKGLPGKNIKELQGKPLLAWSIEVAKNLEMVEQIFVSTEDPDIARTAVEYGAVVIPRPPELAGDSSPEWLSWQHAVEWATRNYGPFDRFLSLPATAPLRSEKNVRDCIDALDSDTDIVLTMTESHRNPWFNMVCQKQEGFIHTVNSFTQDIARRQDAPVTYDLTTVAYVASPRFILSADSIWAGKVKGVLVSRKEAVDIDTPDDFLYAEFLLERG